MLIEIQDVTRSDAQGKNGKSYGVLQVAYRSDGKLQEKKIMSFTNPQVFKTLEGMKKGDTVDVKTEKDANGYWQWTGFSTGASPSSSVAEKPATATTRVTGSTYETPEERAIKQRYIVRQSSLTTALGVLSVGAKAIDKQSVLQLAQEFEEWVFRKEDPMVALGNMEDDVPD